MTVTLSGFDDESNPVLLTAVTDANGLYSFMNLRPSLSALRAGLTTGYTITETQLAGFLDGKEAIGTPGGIAGNGVFSSINLVAGFAGVNNDFGEPPPAGLSGFVYVDANDDGIKQAGEFGIAGVTVTLTGTDDQGNGVSLTTTTAADGWYTFASLRPSGPNGYTLTETQPVGYLDGKDAIGTQNGTSSNDRFGGITVVAGTDGTANNFGGLQPASPSGVTYFDANGNGIKDAAEARIAGVTVTLTGVDDLNQVVNLTTTTVADGSYRFSNLRPSDTGGYSLTEIAPSGYFNGDTNPGPLDGSVSPEKLTDIVLAQGLAGTNNNFGSILPSSLAGFVYSNANDNGVKDLFETGNAGIAVELSGTDIHGNAVQAFATTGPDGAPMTSPV